MSDVKDIINVLSKPSKEDVAFITKAYTFAKNAHKDHFRKSGELYFKHLFATAKGLAEIGMGPTTIAAGFLHDTIEDVHVTPEDIRKKFGDEVLFLVEGVTKLGSLKYRGTKRHTEALRKLFVATSQDVRVVIIKLLDRRHNMQTLEYVSPQKRKRIALETLEIYAPIADRLGIGRLKRELEDLAFPYVYPQEYEETRKLLEEATRHALKHLPKLLKQLQKALVKDQLVRFRTEHRVKGLYSLYKKLERKGSDISKIHDILAVRIIVTSEDDCYRALGSVHRLWKPIPGKIKDYIAFPKPNGYRSLHTTVFAGQSGTVEIQIRTEDMHRRAQYGIASHFSYKAVLSGGRRESAFEWIRQLLPSLRPQQQRLSAKGAPKHKRSESALADVPKWIKEMAEAQEELEESEHFLKAAKADFFSHRVFVFTPHGDVIDLPIDASPIDFAYNVHSDIGNHISGAKVNGKLVSLDTKLTNGDIVEIVTKESAMPSPKWLEMAKTTLAKRHIRSVLQQER